MTAFGVDVFCTNTPDLTSKTATRDLPTLLA